MNFFPSSSLLLRDEFKLSDKRSDFSFVRSRPMKSKKINTFDHSACPITGPT